MVCGCCHDVWHGAQVPEDVQFRDGTTVAAAGSTVALRVNLASRGWKGVCLRANGQVAVIIIHAWFVICVSHACASQGAVLPRWCGAQSNLRRGRFVESGGYCQCVPAGVSLA